MSSQKYYFKGRDLIQLRSMLFKLFITCIIFLKVLLVVFVVPSFSLDWKDEQWKNSGCHEMAMGKWAPDNPVVTPVNFLSIGNTEVLYRSENNPEQSFGIIKKSFDPNNNYLEMKLLNQENSEENIIKIRPHRIHFDFMKDESDSSCLIKVFNFESERHAKTDRYSGWDVYRLLK